MAIVPCQHCTFWEHISSSSEGRCRRHAPAFAEVINDVAHWPLTHAEDSCGEGVGTELAHAEFIKCSTCVYWRHRIGGVDPVQRRDQLEAWWREAGHCVRFAPQPSSEPGARAFWRVSHANDFCFDGSVKQS
jgi:hypothetical protein